MGLNRHIGVGEYHMNRIPAVSAFAFDLNTMFLTSVYFTDRSSAEPRPAGMIKFIDSLSIPKDLTKSAIRGREWMFNLHSVDIVHLGAAVYCPIAYKFVSKKRSKREKISD